VAAGEGCAGAERSKLTAAISVSTGVAFCRSYQARTSPALYAARCFWSLKTPFCDKGGPIFRRSQARTTSLETPNNLQRSERESRVSGAGQASGGIEGSGRMLDMDRV